jgi:hypothetical protein
LPTDIEDDVLALRQWAEVLLACPHDLPEVALDLELFALLRETNKAWQCLFFDPTYPNSSSWRANSYATRTDLLFIPLVDLVKSLKEVIDPDYLVHMQILIDAVASGQRVVEAKAAAIEGSTPTRSSCERVHALPSKERIEALATLHGVSARDMRDWLVLRHVLSSFSWLANRVGDYSVPEISAVFAVFQATPILSGSNSHGRLGLRGMVPIRGSKVRELLGFGWGAQCIDVDRVTIAEREQDFENLLQGIDERGPSKDLSDELVTSASTS